MPSRRFRTGRCDVRRRVAALRAARAVICRSLKVGCRTAMRRNLWAGDTRVTRTRAPEPAEQTTHA